MSPLMMRLAGGALLAGLLGAACGGGASGSASPTALAVITRPAIHAGGSSSCPASAGLGDNVNDHGAARASGKAITLEAGDSFFAPTCGTAVPAGKVMVTVNNTGSALHNFSIPDQGIDIDVAAGKTIEVDVDVSSPSLAFFCKYHRTSGMVGALLQSPG